MHLRDDTTFNYGMKAELFSRRKGQKSRRQLLGYRRFSRAADAIRFAMEELPAQLLVGTYLEVDEERYEFKEIRRLYESVDYPLARRGLTRTIGRTLTETVVK